MNGSPMNGSPMNGSWVAPSPAPSPAADPWPESPLDDFERQRPRLEGEIAAAKARTAAARQRTAAREAEVRAALRAELVASKESVAEIERECDIAIANVRKAAQIEVERILAEAWQLKAQRPEQRDVSHVE